MNQNKKEMNEKNILKDILFSQKKISQNYNLYANECSTPTVRDQFLELLMEEHQIEANIFDEMQKRGWYQVLNAEYEKIEQAKQKLN